MHKLNKDKYKVKSFLRPKRIKKLNYLSLQYHQSSISSLSEVHFLKDKYIQKIKASFTQINNNQAIVQFDMTFNKIMDYEMLIDFIKVNKQALYNKSYVDFYDKDNVLGYRDVYRQLDKLETSTFQAKLNEVVNLPYGRTYNLPHLSVIRYPEEIFSKESLKNFFLCKTFEINNGEQHLIADITSREGLKMGLYFSGKYYRPIPFTHIISNYRMDFYYFLFERLENYELNRRLNKYLVQSKKTVSLKDYKWLVNKVRSINDNKLHMNYEPFQDSLKDWKAFVDGEEDEIEFTKNLYTKKYETIYNELIEHMKIVYSLQKENLIINIGILTLIATITGIIITIFLSS
ncbi:hypothetical protein JF544_18785 [Halobacillus kuroshimensis]|uniref:Uncharacterized protein n=1 Tax=Halobacillus kuroshimensis TaxID=302481 RepID=A0ABS3E1H4_9BACI|nr:hypothetical protein [Halobacillus kuroshimensis]